MIYKNTKIVVIEWGGGGEKTVMAKPIQVLFIIKVSKRQKVSK